MDDFAIVMGQQFYQKYVFYLLMAWTLVSVFIVFERWWGAMWTSILIVVTIGYLWVLRRGTSQIVVLYTEGFKLMLTAMITITFIHFTKVVVYV